MLCRFAGRLVYAVDKHLVNSLSGLHFADQSSVWQSLWPGEMGCWAERKRGNGEKNPMLCSVPDSDLFSWLSPAGDALWWNAGWVPAAKSWAGWVQTVERICITQYACFHLHELGPKDFTQWFLPVSVPTSREGCSCCWTQTQGRLFRAVWLLLVCVQWAGASSQGFHGPPERLSSLVSAFSLLCSAWWICYPCLYVCWSFFVWPSGLFTEFYIFILV